jgi:uncharacterized membrane protein YjjB (DUF3815 family)
VNEWSYTSHDVLLVAAAFVATLCYAVLYHVPKRALIPVGLVGMGAWIIQDVLGNLNIANVGAAFAGGMFVAVASEWLARKMRMPVTVFVVGGIVPLVPGSSAYATMRQFVIGNQLNGLARGTETLLIAAAISAGLLLAGTIVRLDRRKRRDPVTSKQRS